MNELTPSQLEEIAQATFRKTADISLKHAQLNQKYVKKTLADLAPERTFPAAVVVSGGPSIKLKDPIQLVKKMGFEGPLIACDGALGYCLRNDVVPQYVVSVDPHPDRIVRWFGDTKLGQREPDAYFRNQDLDEAHVENELRANAELIRLVNKHGRKMKAILATSISPDIAERCLEAGMEIFWWNPVFDDYDAPGSLTRKLYEMNKAPCLVTGGNVGASSFSFAYAVLRMKVIGLLGMDFSYAPGTPLEKTQYYEHIKQIYPDDPAKAYIQIFNPYLGDTWFTDPAYYWYRQCFLKLVEGVDDDVSVHNCSEGGILFGQRVHFTPFEQFLRKFQKPAAAHHG